MALMCGSCRRDIPVGVHPYTVKVEIYPRVEDSLEIAESDLEIDCIEEIKNIVAALEAMDEAQSKLEEERVYSSFSYVICPGCRDELARQLRQSAFDPQS